MVLIPGQTEVSSRLFYTWKEGKNEKAQLIRNHTRSRLSWRAHRQGLRRIARRVEVKRTLQKAPQYPQSHLHLHPHHPQGVIPSVEHALPETPLHPQRGTLP